MRRGAAARLLAAVLAAALAAAADARELRVVVVAPASGPLQARSEDYVAGVRAAVEDWSGKEDGQVAVFPNPANEVLNVLIPAGETGANVDVLDAMGRVVNSFTTSALDIDQRIVVDIRELIGGIYFVRVAREGTSQVERVVIQR